MHHSEDEYANFYPKVTYSSLTVFIRCIELVAGYNQE